MKSASKAAANGCALTKVYRDATRLEELREFWNSRQTWPTGTLDFFLSVTCAGPEVVRPHVMAVFKDGRPRSLLVGRLQKEKMTIRLGYWRVPVANLRTLVFDDGGWLSDLSTADSELFVRDILASLRSREADAAALHHIETTHPIYELARSLPGTLFSDRMPLLQVQRGRRLEGNGSFLDSLSASRRDNHKRRARRLRKAFGGDVNITCFRDGSQIDQLMEDAEAVAKTSYQRGLGVGFFPDEKMRRRLSLAAEQGTLRAQVLYITGTPCAFWITSFSNGVLYSEFTGYDPAYTKYGIGLYLIVKVIEEICRDEGARATRVEFGPGDADWKAHLSNCQSELANLYIFAPSIKGAGLNLLRTLANLADRSAKAILQRTGLLAGVKRKWRTLITQIEAMPKGTTQ